MWCGHLLRAELVAFADRETAPYADEEIFGQVGFGTGGWDTDFPNSILEILRVGGRRPLARLRAGQGGVR
ncbi:hypothetical protein, partial [Streptomyces albidoflavus]|uniref:hypothetical protein n=1 Tax=Streptomyces albidoflavus TaxID=1886 RepID=UPI001596FF6C